MTDSTKRNNSIYEITKLILIILSSSAVLVFSGCSDNMHSFYSSYADAQEDGVFDRGWLPPVLPDTAYEITERHNLDTNRGTFNFKIDDSQIDAFIAQLEHLEDSMQDNAIRSAPEEIKQLQDAEFFSHSTEKTKFYFCVLRDTNTVYGWH